MGATSSIADSNDEFGVVNEEIDDSSGLLCLTSSNRPLDALTVHGGRFIVDRSKPPYDPEDYVWMLAPRSPDSCDGEDDMSLIETRLQSRIPLRQPSTVHGANDVCHVGGSLFAISGVGVDPQFRENQPLLTEDTIGKDGSVLFDVVKRQVVQRFRTSLVPNQAADTPITRSRSVAYLPKHSLVAVSMDYYVCLFRISDRTNPLSTTPSSIATEVGCLEGDGLVSSPSMRTSMYFWISSLRHFSDNRLLSVSPRLHPIEIFDVTTQTLLGKLMPREISGWPGADSHESFRTGEVIQGEGISECCVGFATGIGDGNNACLLYYDPRTFRQIDCVSSTSDDPFGPTDAGSLLWSSSKNLLVAYFEGTDGSSYQTFDMRKRDAPVAEWEDGSWATSSTKGCEFELVGNGGQKTTCFTFGCSVTSRDLQIWSFDGKNMGAVTKPNCLEDRYPKRKKKGAPPKKGSAVDGICFVPPGQLGT